MAQATHQSYRLHCRQCGQHGELVLMTRGQRDWSFMTVGFIGLAVNRHNPPNSVLRCNSCGSSIIDAAQVSPG